jgi:hypothetical protein
VVDKSSHQKSDSGKAATIYFLLAAFPESDFSARAEIGLLTKMTQTPKSVSPFSTIQKSCPHSTLEHKSATVGIQ